MMRLPMMEIFMSRKNAGGTQYLTLYYVNHEASGRQGKNASGDEMTQKRVRSLSTLRLHRKSKRTRADMSTGEKICM